MRSLPPPPGVHVLPISQPATGCGGNPTCDATSYNTQPTYVVQYTPETGDPYFLYVWLLDREDSRMALDPIAPSTILPSDPARFLSVTVSHEFVHISRLLSYLPTRRARGVLPYCFCHP